MYFDRISSKMITELQLNNNDSSFIDTPVTYFLTKHMKKVFRAKVQYLSGYLHSSCSLADMKSTSKKLNLVILAVLVAICSHCKCQTDDEFLYGTFPEGFRFGSFGASY